MPIYEFSCDSCGHEFERILSFSATIVPACPACEASNVKRRLSTPAIHFKGSGWYITDSKKSNGVNGSEKNGDAKPSTTESKSETSQSESSKGESSKSENAKPESSSSKSEAKAEA